MNAQFLFISCMFILIASLSIANSTGESVIQMFNEKREFVLRVKSKEMDLSSYYKVDDLCLNIVNKKLNAVKDPRRFKSKVFIYQSTNYNLRFMLELSFISAINESRIQGYNIRIFDTSPSLRSSCIRIMKNHENSTIDSMIKKFSITIKDPVILKNPNSSFTFYFGRVSFNSIKACNMDTCVHKNSEENYVDAGILSSNKEYNIEKPEKLPDCLQTLVWLTCFQSYIDKTTNKSYFIILHQFPRHIAQVYHQFGLTKNFSRPFIAYDNETMYNIIFKITQNITSYDSFYYTNYLTVATASNACKAPEICSCENECIECFINITEKNPAHVYDVRAKAITPACNSNQFSGIEFHDLPFKARIHDENPKNNIDDLEDVLNSDKNNDVDNEKNQLIAGIGKSIYAVVIMIIIILLIIIISAVVLIWRIHNKILKLNYLKNFKKKLVKPVNVAENGKFLNNGLNHSS